MVAVVVIVRAFIIQTIIKWHLSRKELLDFTNISTMPTMQRTYNTSCACTSLRLALGCLASATPCHASARVQVQGALAGLDVDGERGRVHELPPARGAAEGRALLAGLALLADVWPARGGQ